MHQSNNHLYFREENDSLNCSDKSATADSDTCQYGQTTNSGTSLSASDGNYESIDIRPCRTHEELDECVRLQQQVWHFNDLDTVPRRVFIVSNNIGGVVLGAYAASHSVKPLLVGFLWALPGCHHGADTDTFMYVEMLAVHPNARNHHIGQKLMWKINEYALRQAITTVMATFDPTDIKLAHLYINRLGGIVRRYTSEYYGASSSFLHTLPTDRLHLEWRHDSLDRQQRSDPLRHRAHVLSDSNHTDEVRLPADMEKWKQCRDTRAMDAQRELRDKLKVAFDQGRAIIGFEREQDGAGIYLLGHSPQSERKSTE